MKPNLETRARAMRAEGKSLFDIGIALRISLSHVRRLVDPKAQAAHEQWQGR